MNISSVPGKMPSLFPPSLDKYRINAQFCQYIFCTNRSSRKAVKRETAQSLPMYKGKCTVPGGKQPPGDGIVDEVFAPAGIQPHKISARRAGWPCVRIIPKVLTYFVVCRKEFVEYLVFRQTPQDICVMLRPTDGGADEPLPPSGRPPPTTRLPLRQQPGPWGTVRRIQQFWPGSPLQPGRR